MGETVRATIKRSIAELGGSDDGLLDETDEMIARWERESKERIARWERESLERIARWERGSR